MLNRRGKQDETFSEPSLTHMSLFCSFEFCSVDAPTKMQRLLRAREDSDQIKKKAFVSNSQAVYVTLFDIHR